MNNSSDDDIDFGEDLKNIDIDSYHNFFNYLKGTNSYIKKSVLFNFIKQSGISLDDNRIKSDLDLLDDKIIESDFIDLINTNILLFKKIFEKDLIISDWMNFTKNIDSIYNNLIDYDKGKIADYIPQLANVNPNLFSVSICSIDGQIYNKGDYNNEFCVQSCSKPITYLIASDLLGGDYVHNFVGREPSGRNFNELCLNNDKIPHNPLINSGAIMCASLIDYKNSLANRFDKIIKYWSKLAANSKINFSTSVYLSERASADRNNCLAYMMQGIKSFFKRC